VSQRVRSLAAKLDRLFRTVHPPGRGEYSLSEVAEGIRALGGPSISGAYIWQLRGGKRVNPTMSTLESLAEFFGVPPAYFLDEETRERIDAQLDLLAAMRDSQVSRIALRSFGLSPESLQAIAGVIENARRREGLPDGDEQATRSRGPRADRRGRRPDAGG
jgi:transcriptional regulator with XRE-family HTH domain